MSPRPSDPDPSPVPRPDLVDALARTAFVVTGVLSRVAAEHDLSLTQMRVLGILRDRSPRMAELATHLGLEKSTTSGLVDRAVRRGLLTRTPSPDDGRAAHVSLTQAGARLAERGYDQVRAALLPHTASLEADEQEALAALLLRMVAVAPR